MRIRLLAPLLLLPALLGGRSADPSGWVSLRRGPCFGNCPIYEVALRADGSATYAGGDYAPRQGRFEGKVDPAAVERLLDRLDRIGFWEMRLDQQLRVMDLPEAVLAAKDGDRQHRVHTNLPPPELERIQLAVDSLAATVEWLPARDPAPPPATR